MVTGVICWYLYISVIYGREDDVMTSLFAIQIVKLSVYVNCCNCVNFWLIWFIYFLFLDWIYYHFVGAQMVIQMYFYVSKCYRKQNSIVLFKENWNVSCIFIVPFENLFYTVWYGCLFFCRIHYCYVWWNHKTNTVCWTFLICLISDFVNIKNCCFCVDF